MQNVALLGLGTMGAGMAGRLIAAGFPWTVWNRNRDRAQAFAVKCASSKFRSSANIGLIFLLRIFTTTLIRPLRDVC